MIDQDHIDDIMRQLDNEDDRRRVRLAVNKASRVRRDTRGKPRKS